jgi:hypothetical protein
MQRFSLARRSRYPTIFLVTVAALATGIQLIVPTVKQAEAYLPAVAAAAGFAYFLYNQHLQETRLFTELFKQFNAKYDSLNERLNSIAMDSQATVLSSEDRQVLFDYFNLCAEEYLYYKTGYIDIEVWKSWCNGMRQFATARHIRDLWESELANGSYYEFKLVLLEVSSGA